MTQFYSIMMVPDAIEELRREAALLAQLRHPNVMSFFGVCSRGDDIFIVTEYCPGSLQAWLQNPDNKGNLPAARQIALDVARGMRYLHGRGVVVSSSVRCLPLSVCALTVDSLAWFDAVAWTPNQHRGTVCVRERPAFLSCHPSYSHALCSFFPRLEARQCPVDRVWHGTHC